MIHGEFLATEKPKLLHTWSCRQIAATGTISEATELATLPNYANMKIDFNANSNLFVKINASQTFYKTSNNAARFVRLEIKPYGSSSTGNSAGTYSGGTGTGLVNGFDQIANTGSSADYGNCGVTTWFRPSSSDISTYGRYWYFTAELTSDNYTGLSLFGGTGMFTLELWYNPNITETTFTAGSGGP